MPPFFSIIVPTYNRAALIGKTIDSILAQSFGDFELIIVDDGSKDDTERVVAGFKDTRIRFFKKENGERGAARNWGIRQAEGTYVTFIDSDDLLYPYAFEQARSMLQEYGHPDCYAQAYEVVEAGSGKVLQQATRLEGKTVNTEIVNGNFLGCIGVFVRRSILEQIGFEEDRMFAGTEDWLLWLRLAARYPFCYSGKVCASMIEHESRSVLSFSEDKLRYRTEHLKAFLLADPACVQHYGVRVINRIYAHMLTYTSLHLAMSRQKGKALKYLLKAGTVSPAELWSRRTLGIFKTILLR